jgi:hypothetical protein
MTTTDPIARAWTDLIDDAIAASRDWLEASMANATVDRAIASSPEPAQPMRKCRLCGEVKPLEEFARQGHGEQRRHQCAPCWAGYCRDADGRRGPRKRKKKR